MSSRILIPTEPDPRYEKWRGAFMRVRLRLGALFGILALATFLALNLSRWPEIEQPWLNTNLTQVLTTQASVQQAADANDQPAPAQEDGVARLAEALEGLVTQMRKEQQVVRDWAEDQAAQQAEMRDMIARATVAPKRTTRSSNKDS